MTKTNSSSGDTVHKLILVPFFAMLAAGCGKSSNVDLESLAKKADSLANQVTEPTQPPIKVESHQSPHVSFPSFYLSVTATENQVTIEGLTVNRGNCEGDTSQLPKTIKFGEQASFGMNLGCDNILEAEIKTDLGTYTFNWD